MVDISYFGVNMLWRMYLVNLFSIVVFIEIVVVLVIKGERVVMIEGFR